MVFGLLFFDVSQCRKESTMLSLTIIMLISLLPFLLLGGGAGMLAYSIEQRTRAEANVTAQKAAAEAKAAATTKAEARGAAAR